MTDILNEQSAVDLKDKIAEDVFTDFLALHKKNDRFDLYDLIIDNRRRLFDISFEQCRKAIDTLEKRGILRQTMVKNLYALNKDFKK